MLNQIFYENEEYSIKAEWCNNNNCHIEEIEPDDKGRRFKIVENTFSEKEKAKIEIQELKTWFETYYKEHEQKYRRLYTLKLKCDDGADPYEKLLNLYAEAEIIRKKIQKLEELLNG